MSLSSSYDCCVIETDRACDQGRRWSPDAEPVSDGGRVDRHLRCRWLDTDLEAHRAGPGAAQEIARLVIVADRHGHTELRGLPH